MGRSCPDMARNYQVSVVGVTISAEQQKMAQARCADLDVEIRLQDYRDLHDSFDRIVSVGMFEHVGPKNYATYFEVADRNLKPNGRFLLHTIGSKVTDHNVDPWIDKYLPERLPAFRASHCRSQREAFCDGRLAQLRRRL